MNSEKEPPVKIADLPRKLTEDETSKGNRAILVFLADEKNPAKANLAERVWKGELLFPIAENITIHPQLADVDKVVLTQFGKSDKNRLYGDCNDFIGRPLGKAIDSNYRFERSYYSEFGLILLKRRDGDFPPSDNISERDAYGFAWQDWQEDRTLFALGSPIGFLGLEKIIQFENDTILFELRHHQLCLFDYRTRRIALLARGYGATAAIEEDSTKDHE